MSKNWGTNDPLDRGKAGWKPTSGKHQRSTNNLKDDGFRGRRQTDGQEATGAAASTSAQSTDSSRLSIARFDEACEKIRKTTEMFLEKDNGGAKMEVCSSDDDDENENSERNTSILYKVLSPYSQLNAKNDIGRTENFLLDAIKPGANMCLICLSSIKKVEAIWACDGCFCVFHLPCIQTWAKDCIQQQQSKQSGGQDSPIWCCPKCRHEYSNKECPTKYTCYCGKVLDPAFDAWLIPHTCGQTCERNLRPFCGHKCLLLCHPGPCPPCPKMVHTSCHCRRQKSQARRCSSQLWSCGKPCGSRLSCGQHQCKKPCHEGPCSLCQMTSIHACLCGKEKMSRPCADPSWHCTAKCELPLSCGHHRCDEVCHSGQCSECPRSNERSCPCGKVKLKLPCTQDIPACGDTCGKPLSCGIHTCAQRCHAGVCGTCLQMTVKTCRCGQKTRSMPCCKEYLCEVKCKATKNCGRHLCNRKCCDGNCPPCEQLCGRSLRCRNHKCNSPCHQGPCYPCPLMYQVKCRCGGTISSVPCGTEKNTTPPKCSIPCRIPPKCDHKGHVPPHRCHFNLCPPCRQPCNKILNCLHKCLQRCHTNVLTKVEVEQKRAGPWEPMVAPRMEYISSRCPPCLFPVPVTCVGKHETRDFPCSQANSSSCASRCARKLSCGNHTCSLSCHSVEAGNNCAPCDLPCSLPRPEGCPHPCLKVCHPTSCPPCRQMIQQRCLCGLAVQFVPCLKWTSTSVALRRSLLSCGNQCPKSIRCGHRCALLCHDGPCSTSEECQKKVIIKCECKRLKKESLCSLLQAGKAKAVHCDAVCLEKQENERKLKAENELKQKREEMQKNREEVEKLRRKLEGKRRKHRKEKSDPVTTTVWDKYAVTTVLFIGAICALVVAVMFYVALIM